MNVLFTFRTYVSLLSFTLCATSLNLFSVDKKSAKITESEMRMILEEKQNSYVCLSEELSKLAYVVEKLSLLDTNKNSIIHQFKKHIDNEASIALYDEVLEALLYGEALLNKHRNAFEGDKKDLFVAFDAVMTELLNGELSFEKTIDGFLRSPQLRLLVVDENMVVLGKVKFKEDVKFEDDVTFKKHIKTKQGIHVEGKLVVDKKAVFESDVIIGGTLSVADVVIASCVDNLCVNNLSAVDVAISGTLSANDAFITNATIDNIIVISPTTFTDVTINGTASITDAIITNATITNLSATDVVTTNLQVTNCVPNLCVLTLSAQDEVLNGNLVLTTEPSTATAGNIIKGVNRFIHDFGTDNTFVGINSGNFTTSGTGNNSGFGFNALTSIATGFGNTGIGFNSLSLNTDGGQNTAVGNTTLSANTTGGANTAVGFRAMEANTIGGANTAVGQNTLLVNTTGGGNVAVGAHALQTNTIGNLNIGIGFNTLASLVTGEQNTAIGCNSFEGLITGSNNTAIGNFAGQNSTGASSNNIYINNLGAVENNTIRIGTAANQTSCFIAGIFGVTTGLAGVGVFVDANGQLGTISSSASVKHDIKDMNLDSADVLNLRPVTFVYNADETNTRQYGLIAEEVDKAFPALVVYDAEGQPRTVQYHVLPVLLLNEVKKQHSTIEKMNDAMASLHEQVQEFIGRVKTLENQA